MNIDAPKYLFISLQLHIFKSGKVAEIGEIPVGVKVFGDRLKMSGSGNRLILVEIGAKNMPNVSPVFPHNDGEWWKQVQITIKTNRNDYVIFSI